MNFGCRFVLVQEVLQVVCIGCVLFVGGLWQQQSCASETINIKHPRLLVCRRMFSALLPHLLLWSSWENGLYLGDELSASSAGHS